MARGSTAAIKAKAIEKHRRTSRSKLVPRLARYLGDESRYGKQKVRVALRAGGYRGPGWKDEGRAITILSAAGHDMSKFERSGRGDSKFRSMARTYSAPTTSESAAPEAAESTDRMRRVVILLKQGEEMIKRDIKNGARREIDGVAVQLLAALNELR